MQNIVLTSLFAFSSMAAATPVKLLARDGGCSDTSFHDFEWTIKDFDYHASYIFTTPAHQNSWGYVNFNITNPAVPFTVPCSAASSQLSDFFYGTQIYTCTLPEDAPAGAGPTTFTFSRPSGELAVNQTWTCSDVDPQYPTTFGGSGSLNFTLDCTDTTWTNPNWTIGQIYSDREVKCAPVDVPLKPSQLTAVA